MEYGLFRLVTGIVGLLPEGAALAVGGFLGWLRGSVLRIRRSVVDRHLEMAYPDRSEAWRRRVARASYRHLGRESVAMLRMSALDRDDLVARTRVEGLEAVQHALERGRGIVFVTGHLGNWEIGGAAVAARGVPVAAVALRQGNPLFDRDLVRTREELGMRVIYKIDAPRSVLRTLNAGGTVALVADQNPIRGGIPVEFFGREANTARGPAVLALRSGAPVFLGVALRTEGGDHDYDVTLREVPVEPSGDLEDDVHRLVQAYTVLLETAIREAPEQYFWHHRRWKRRG
ncbi:MAG: lysophospholipid acyltransferase family protein [Longimicrobiales bacterium]